MTAAPIRLTTTVARLGLPLPSDADDPTIAAWLSGLSAAPPLTTPEAVADEVTSLLASWAFGLSGDAATVLLSGGVDSILLMTTVRRFRPDVALTAVHLATPHADANDRRRAEEASAALDVPLRLVLPGRDDVIAAVRQAIDLLGVTDLWEVAAGASETLLAGAAHDLDGPFLDGGGADALFYGGQTKPSGTDLEAWRASSWVPLATTMLSSRRLTPDFFERFWGDDSARRMWPYQSVEMVGLGRRATPDALWVERDEGTFDKAGLRLAAERLGAPAELVWSPKTPLQESSGVYGSVLDYVGDVLAADPADAYYRDPRTEPAHHTTVRLALRLLKEGLV